MNKVMIVLAACISVAMWLIPYNNYMEEIDHYEPAGFMIDGLEVYYYDNMGEQLCSEPRYFNIYTEENEDGSEMSYYIKGIESESYETYCTYTSNYFIKVDEITETPVNTYLIDMLLDQEYITVRLYEQYYDVSSDFLEDDLEDADIVKLAKNYSSISEDEVIRYKSQYYVKAVYNALMEVYEYNGSCPTLYEVKWDSIMMFLDDDVIEYFDQTVNEGLVATFDGSCYPIMYLVEAGAVDACAHNYGERYFTEMSCDVY